MSSGKTDLTGHYPLPNKRQTDAVCSGSPFAKKERMRCLFCGGDQCKRCGPTAYQQLEKPAIPNLHSSWINESIIAMQRPSDALLEEGNVLEGFQLAHITAVFNLTEPGEHPYCGAGIIESTGFPYTPEKLMKAGIKHYNFHWADMTAPSVAMMMEIAHLGTAEINRGGKIAVHCHAGYGRTGMAIACILIFKDQVESAQVITFIRNRRPGSIQTATQERFIHKFERSYRFMMQSFPTKDSLDLSTIDEHRERPSFSNSISAGLHLTSPTNHTHITEATNTSLYLKTLRQSVHDQHYLLNPIELTSRMFQNIHKLVYFTTMAIAALCKEYVVLAHLGITGLNKLVPKENTSHKFTSNLSKHNMNVLMSAPSYMVATNSMSQGLEETILTDIKIEINANKWTRFLSVADVVAISLQLGQESVKRLTKVASTMEDKAYASPGGSGRASPGTASAGGMLPSVESGRVVRNNSMFRGNSFKETSDADYNKSKRVSANIMSQLLIDWLETRQNCIFDTLHASALEDIWIKHYPSFGKLGWARHAWKELRTRTRAYLSFEEDLLAFLHNKLDKYRLEVLGCVVSMFHTIHCAGCDSNNEDGENEAPSMDTLVALRLAIAFVHGRKQQHLLIRHRSLNMELVKLFMLKHADAEPVIINNITFMAEHAAGIAGTMGVALVQKLEVIVRTLLVLQEIRWTCEGQSKEKVGWRSDTVEAFAPVEPLVENSAENSGT